MSKSLSSLLADLPAVSVIGPSNPMIEGIYYDSRKIRKGSLFVALPGIHADGHSYIESAIAKGAVAVLCESDPDRYIPEVSYVHVVDARLAMSKVAAAFYDHPSSSLRTIGVTGTRRQKHDRVAYLSAAQSCRFESGFFFHRHVGYRIGRKAKP